MTAYASRATIAGVVEADWEQPGEDAGQTVGERVRSLRRSAGLSQEAARSRALLEGVREPDRAGEDSADARDARVARRSSRNRSRVSRARVQPGGGRAVRGRRARTRSSSSRRVAYEAAVAAYRDARAHAGAALTAASALRLLRGEAWALIRTGDLDAAMSALEEAAALAVGRRLHGRRSRGGRVPGRRRPLLAVEHPRGDRPLRPGARPRGRLVVRLDRLRSDIFHWRSRCHRRNRDWVAAAGGHRAGAGARRSVRRPRRVADALFQASLVAQRQGRWVLARTDAERSRALFEELGDRATAARLLNNLAGLDHLLGDAIRRDRAARERRSRSSSTWTSRSMRATSARRSRRFGSPATSRSWRRHRRARRSSSSATASTISRRSARRSSRSGARSPRRAGSTKPSSGSRPRRRRFEQAQLGRASQLRMGGARAIVESQRGNDRDAAGSLPASGAGAAGCRRLAARRHDDGLPPRRWRETASSVSIRLSLAAVEPAPAKTGEEAGERRRCDNEVARISLGEHSRTSFRMTGLSSQLSARSTDRTPPNGGSTACRDAASTTSTTGCGLPGSDASARSASRRSRRPSLCGSGCHARAVAPDGSFGHAGVGSAAMAAKRAPERLSRTRRLRPRRLRHRRRRSRRRLRPSPSSAARARRRTRRRDRRSRGSRRPSRGRRCGEIQ